MQDSEIVDLYWQRSSAAIRETEKKYGGYCQTLAYQILANREDSEECVNDTWLRAWNAMPEQRPSLLGAFLGKITRRLALNRLRDSRRRKRGGGEAALCLEELDECIPDRWNSVESQMELRELSQAIDRFLAGLDRDRRDAFVSRYWYMAPVEEIAQSLGQSKGGVKSGLFRTRKSLKTFLEKEGYEL